MIERWLEMVGMEPTSEYDARFFDDAAEARDYQRYWEGRSGDRKAVIGQCGYAERRCGVCAECVERERWSGYSLVSAWRVARGDLERNADIVRLSVRNREQWLAEQRCS